MLIPQLDFQVQQPLANTVEPEMAGFDHAELFGDLTLEHVERRAFGRQGWINFRRKSHPGSR
jgi:hypothetical protein